MRSINITFHPSTRLLKVFSSRQHVNLRLSTLHFNSCSFISIGTFLLHSTILLLHLIWRNHLYLCNPFREHSLQYLACASQVGARFVIYLRGDFCVYIFYHWMCNIWNNFDIIGECLLRFLYTHKVGKCDQLCFTHLNITELSRFTGDPDVIKPNQRAE